MRCKVNRCDRKLFCSGLCRTHYRWHKEGKPLDGPIRSKKITEDKCSVPNCERWATGSGWCRVCWQRWKRTGGPLGPLKESPTTVVDSAGYVRYYASHPDNTSGKTRYEHHIVMEKALGRPLVDCENVHHINGNRSDNRLENLELWNTSQPSGQRVEDKVQWAKEIIALYGELAS